MKKGFYMGYDARGLSDKEIMRQAKLLLDGGYYRAGYRTLRLYEGSGKAANALHAMGFKLDVTIDADTPDEEAIELVSKLGAQGVTIQNVVDKAEVEQLVSALGAGVRVSLCVPQADMAWAAQLADVAELNAITDDADFFEITRNQLDSCREGDTDAARSDANLRADAMPQGAAYAVGALSLRFDEERNRAIFAQMCMLGCPLVLRGDVSDYPEHLARLVRDDKLIRIAASGLGRTVRYYDPWHVLLGKPCGDAWWMLVLNRCHGDTFTDITPADMGWDSRFAMWDCMSGEMIGESLEKFEVHVETSDHPQTPCCKLYRVEKA